MDPIEQGFLQALREDPEDHTTRLVYADWLDDRDDPRGVFLRAEIELVALPAGEERARELQARLGRAVMTVESVWVVAVSLVGHQLFQMWRDLTKNFEPTSRGGPSKRRTSRCGQWRESGAGLGDLYSTRFPALTREDRFRVPLDYSLFCSTIGGGGPRDGAVDPELIMFSIEGVYNESRYWLESMKEPQTHPNGLWLSIGFSSSQGGYHLCCDCLHPAFGSVYESVDGTGPWSEEFELMNLLAPSFLDFLRTIPP